MGNRAEGMETGGRRTEEGGRRLLPAKAASIGSKCGLSIIKLCLRPNEYGELCNPITI